jgi:hypothetical protein
MSKEQDNYQSYAAGVPIDDEDVVTSTPAEDVVEPVIIEEPKVEVTPEPKAPAAKAESPAPSYVVGDGDVDEVKLDACVYKNVYARKSLTVHHLQRRLGELGYGDANNDRDGWYGDLTKQSVKEYQKDNSLEATGLMDATTFARVFAGDRNVAVVLPE